MGCNINDHHVLLPTTVLRFASGKQNQQQQQQQLLDNVQKYRQLSEQVVFLLLKSVRTFAETHRGSLKPAKALQLSKSCEETVGTLSQVMVGHHRHHYNMLYRHGHDHDTNIYMVIYVGTRFHR